MQTLRNMTFLFLVAVAFVTFSTQPVSGTCLYAYVYEPDSWGHEDWLNDCYFQCNGYPHPDCNEACQDQCQQGVGYYDSCMASPSQEDWCVTICDCWSD